MLPRLLVCLLVAHRLAIMEIWFIRLKLVPDFLLVLFCFLGLRGIGFGGKVVLAILGGFLWMFNCNCRTIPSCSECLRRLGVKTLPEIPFCLYFGCKSKNHPVYTPLPLPSLCNFRNSLGSFFGSISSCRWFLITMFIESS